MKLGMLQIGKFFNDHESAYNNGGRVTPNISMEHHEGVHGEQIDQLRSALHSIESPDYAVSTDGLVIFESFLSDIANNFELVQKAADSFNTNMAKGELLEVRPEVTEFFETLRAALKVVLVERPDPLNVEGVEPSPIVAKTLETRKNNREKAVEDIKATIAQQGFDPQYWGAFITME